MSKKKKIYCLKCGLINDYKVIGSPRLHDSEDFKYSKCKCGSQQPLCLGKGCLDVTSLSCPKKEYDACMRIMDKKIKYRKMA